MTPPFTRPLLASVLLAMAAPAVGNGYLFFNERNTARRLSYVGAVVDTQGRPVGDAQVAISVLPINYTIFLTTDDQGLYRSTTAPTKNRAQVRITAIKAGFRLVRAVPLSREPAPGHPLATNFILAAR